MIKVSSTEEESMELFFIVSPFFCDMLLPSPNKHKKKAYTFTRAKTASKVDGGGGGGGGKKAGLFGF